jgi:hypothetical protein
MGGTERSASGSRTSCRRSCSRAIEGYPPPGRARAEGEEMSVCAIVRLSIVSALTMLLAACETSRIISQPTAVQEPIAEMPATIRSDQIVGRWGLASYQNPNDRARTEAAARAQCKQPYVIKSGASGGVIMHLADDATPQDLRLKGTPGGKNYIGPPGPAGGQKDREIISANGNLLVTRFVDPDAATRYGNMVYVRCK